MTTNCMCSIRNKEYVGDPARRPTEGEVRKYNIWQCMCGKWLFVNQELVECVECKLHFSRSVPLNVCHNCLDKLAKSQGIKKGEIVTGSIRELEDRIRVLEGEAVHGNEKSFCYCPTCKIEIWYFVAFNKDIHCPKCGCKFGFNK